MLTKRFYNYSLLSLVFLIIFFLSAILSSRTILKGEMVTIPDLLGKTLNEAKEELAKKKLALVLKGLQFDSRWERGQIMYQEPSSGSKIKARKPVKVIISDGSEMVEIPQFTGRSIEAASQILNEKGLMKGKISQIYTSRYSAGRIIVQEPSPAPPPQRVKRNTPIGFLVSQGEKEEQYLMPDLIGKKSAPTISLLKKMDFKIADVRHSYYPGLEAGIIIKQFPPHGYRIQKRNLITLEVSK